MMPPKSTLKKTRIPEWLVRSRGFSFIEMMVVLAIVGILASVVVWNYQTTIKQRAASDAAQTIRLMIREAEIWANSSRQFPLDADPSDADYADRYDKGFGVHLRIAEPKKLLLYGGNDTNSYDYTSSDQKIKEINLPEGARIKQLCRTVTVSGADCLDPLNTFPDVTYITLFFRRPSRVPIINEDIDYKHAKIRVGAEDTSDYDWNIEMYQSGRVELIKL